MKHAKHHKSAPGKEAMTAERRTWDLTDGLRFIKSNLDKLAKSSAITAFAGPSKENPSRLLQNCISDRNDAPGKEAITAERRTWDLADGLRFIKSNMDKLANSSAVTAFAGPTFAGPPKQNPTKIVQECINDRHAYAHVMLETVQGGRAQRGKWESGSVTAEGSRSCLAMMVSKYSKLQPNRRRPEAAAPPAPPAAYHLGGQKPAVASVWIKTTKHGAWEPG
ncbi:hypothetical protein HDU88_007126 [Geranomyces variabilis]|nr:hypothetical protein HDU88_007126 [Geranomyces variabilis]